jgi:SAM-dependent methyltransferase
VSTGGATEAIATVSVARCPACGSARRTHLFESRDWIYEVPGSFPLVGCDDCRCVYPDPRPAPESLPAAYPDDYYAYREPARHDLFSRRDTPARLWYALRRGVLRTGYGYEHLGGSGSLARTVGRLPLLRDRATYGLDALLHPFVPGGALLDVGCGAGDYLDLMRALGWERVVGVDASEAAVRALRHDLGIEGHLGDVRDLGLPAETFDAASMSHALEHVDDPVAVLAEIRRLLRPEGRLAIVVPNVRSMLSRLLREHWLGLETPRHLVNLSPAGLRIAIERAGLRLDSLRTSPRGSGQVARFSIARRRGDGSGVYRDDQHRFSPYRRLEASALSAAERVLTAGGRPVGELIVAVARR